MPMTAQPIGFAVPPSGEPVSMLAVGLNHRPSSEIVRPRNHPPVPILPFRVPSRTHPLRSFRSGAYLPGFRPSSRLHQWRLLPAASTQLLLSSVLRFSRPLDGLLHHRLSGLLSSRCHVQGSLPFKAFSLRAATFPRREELPPCWFVCCPLTDFRRLPRQLTPASRLRSTRSSVLTSARFRRTGGRCLPRVPQSDQPDQPVARPTELFSLPSLSSDAIPVDGCPLPRPCPIDSGFRSSVFKIGRAHV